jgi:integrase/recombinase XerD
MAERKLPRFLTTVEMEEIFRLSTKNPRDNMIIACLFYLGLRNSEMRKLLIEDVDILNGNIKIVQGKGQKDRYVPIPDFLVERIKFFISDRRDGPLFVGRNKVGLISGRHIRRIVKEYAKLANVRKYEEIHPHTLRHSYATLIKNQGHDLVDIQRLLGHKNIKTTTIYTHLGIDDLKRTVNSAVKNLG